MGRIIYFTGGARSGKSAQAEQYIFERNYEKKIYIATAIPFDDEMKLRVKKHQEQRGKGWITLEGYKKLVEKITPHIQSGGVILLDCLTNMVSNLMIMEEERDWEKISVSEVEELEHLILTEVKELFDFFKKIDMDVVVVSNEIGMDIVPAYSLGRYFRDICGRVNQIAGKYSDEAYIAISGLQLKLK